MVLGKAGGTFDVELGVAPTLRWNGITIAFPTYITVGPSEFWGTGAFSNDQNFGVASTAVKLSTPIEFANGRKAVAYVQAQDYYLINDNLLLSKSLLNGGDSGRNQLVVGLGLAFSF
ncbi:MAG: hypothetical protein ACKVRO_13555 [Micropepsaceae bacterium]